jgi:hypothetical protein
MIENEKELAGLSFRKATLRRGRGKRTKKNRSNKKKP